MFERQRAARQQKDVHQSKQGLIDCCQLVTAFTSPKRSLTTRQAPNEQHYTACIRLLRIHCRANDLLLLLLPQPVSLPTLEAPRLFPTHSDTSPFVLEQETQFSCLYPEFYPLCTIKHPVIGDRWSDWIRIVYAPPIQLHHLPLHAIHFTACRILRGRQQRNRISLSTHVLYHPQRST